ncbi:MAG: caspase family protein [Acidobacteriota bacterium]
MTDLRSEATVSRRIATDDRSADALASGLRRAVRREPEVHGLRGAGRRAIVLSASADHELSAETAVDGQKHGLFTAKLAHAFADLDPSVPTRWSAIFPTIATAVTAENLGQHPRRQGDGPIFEPGAIDPDDVEPPDVIELRKLAVVIGVDYRRDEDDDTPTFPPLRTPHADARAVAETLRDVQGYEVVGLSKKHDGPLLGAKATRRRIHKVIQRLAAVKARASRDSAVVIYFAGHGVVRTDDQGRQVGYLVPWDADPDDASTWLAMADLRDQLVDGIRDAERLARLEQTRPLERLTSRHVLLVLDCCFGGALAYDFFRGDDTPDRPIYYSEYRRFVEGTAWQLLNSAAFDQQALDRDPRDPDQPHSPFARALIHGLTSDAADQPRSSVARDHIVTATELHQHIDASLRAMGVEIQSPGLTPLRPNNGEFVFHVPGYRPSPLPDPPLDPASNPWRGDAVYDASSEFYGREQATLDLLDGFLRRGDRPVALIGPTGCGASSLIRAGLLPILDDPHRERERLLSWARRRGLEVYSISADDLAAVRAWIVQLDLDLDGSPDTVAETIRAWAKANDLLDGVSGTAEVQATIDRERLGMPAFDDSDRFAFLRRIGVLRLFQLGATDLLVDRLRVWQNEGGLIDFLTVPDRALRDLVGRWTIAPCSTAPSDEVRADATRADGTREAGARLVVLDPATADDLAAIASEAGPDLVAVVTGGHGAVIDPGVWSIVSVPRPTRQELREAIEGPAAERVLVFEPPQVVDAVIEDLAAAPAPWPSLSLLLGQAYERAWARRGSSERTLTLADLPPRIPSPRHPSGPIAERAEAVYRALEGRALRRTARHLVLRTTAFDWDQPEHPPRRRLVPWRELDMADADERTRLRIALDRWTDARVLVASRNGVELGHGRTLDAWPRLRRWLASLRRSETDLQTLWHRGLGWEASEFRTEARRDVGSKLLRLLRSSALCRLEQAVVVATEMARRQAVAEALAAETVGRMLDDWPPAIERVVRLAALALDTERLAAELFPVERIESLDEVERAAHRQAVGVCAEIRWMAEQMLHTALSATPLSTPLTIPTSVPADSHIDGLRWIGEERLLVRLRLPSGDVQTLAWQLGDPPEPTASDQTPDADEHRIRPQRRLGVGPEDRFPVISNAPPGAPTPWPGAQTAHDRAIRYFPPGLLLAPPAVRRPPLKLLGHRGVPTFLAFSTPPSTLAERLRRVAERERPLSTPRWLASAAHGPAGPEARVWAIAPDGRPPSHPRAHVDTSVADVAPDWLAVRTDPASPTTPLVLTDPHGRRRATGHADGRVDLATIGPETGAPTSRRPVTLRGRPDEGFAVRALAFAPDGGCLAVERRAVHAPYARRVDVYDLDIEILIRRARHHAGLASQPSGRGDGDGTEPRHD